MDQEVEHAVGRPFSQVDLAELSRGLGTFFRAHPQRTSDGSGARYDAVVLLSKKVVLHVSFETLKTRVRESLSEAEAEALLAVLQWETGARDREINTAQSFSVQQTAGSFRGVPGGKGASISGPPLAPSAAAAGAGGRRASFNRLGSIEDRLAELKRLKRESSGGSSYDI